MPDIPSASAVSAVSATAAAASNNIVVETAINSVPDKIQQLMRQIEVTGTIAQPPAGDTVTVNTLIGPLTLLLPQLAQAQQDKLLQQLISLFQSQKPLTVVMQPGNPPSQAFLLLPPVTATTQNITGPANPAQPLPAQAPSPLTPNIVLTAVVLPNDTEIPVLPPALTQAPSQPGQPPFPAAGYPNLNPNAGFEPVVLPGYSGAAINPVPIPGLPIAPLQELTAEEAIANAQEQLPPNPTAPSGATPAPIPFPSSPPLPQGVSPVAFQMPNLTPNAPATESFSFSLAGLPQASPQAQSLAPPSLATLLQPGTEVSLRVTAVINPQNQSPPPLQPNQIIATVTGSGPGGQIILKTDNNATLFVRQPLSVPPGTQLVVTVDPAPNDAQVPLPLPNLMEFASLPQIMAALAQFDPAALQQFITRMPQASETLPSALLLFLSAVRGGDARGWMGNDTADLLMRAGKAELIGKLAQELQQSGQPSHDDVVGEWRSYAVPVLDNNHLAAFYFHIHGERRRHAGSHEQKPADGKTAPAQVRFVIDVRMSRLGFMQLDGFLRPKKLDIIMRSENRLPPWLDGELRQTYKHTLDAIGYSGGISFQTGRGSWVNVQKPAAGAAVVT